MEHVSQHRHRIAVMVTALALLAAACGAGSASSGESTGDDASGTTGSNQQAQEVRSGPPVPTAVFTTFDGEATTLGDFCGRPVVVNFWASWCPSCVAEMSAAFRPVHEDLGDDVLFVGMNIQDDRDAALALLDETGVQWLNAEDPAGELYVELGGLGMPFTVYISADGRVLETHNGPLNEQQLRQQIQEHLLG